MIPTDRSLRPAIREVGKVVKSPGGMFTVTGWGLGSCMHNCPCHRDPASNQLRVTSNDRRGLLGLQQFSDCNCCRPWTAPELLAIAGDLAGAEKEAAS